jgi:hypothetical protein
VYAQKTAILYALKRKGVQFVWCLVQWPLEELKQALSEPPVLQIPDFSKEFILVRNANDLAVLEVLH